jgi:hypothetical protein
MTWNHDEMIRSLPQYERDLEAEGLVRRTIDGYLRHATWFLEWRVGLGALRGRETRKPAAPAVAKVDEAQLRADLVEYQDYVAASSTPKGVQTYGYSAKQYIEWLTGHGHRGGRAATKPPKPPAAVAAPPPPPHGEDAWPSEASVQSSIVAWLVSEGWRIKRVADTRAREHGVDVTAVRGADLFLVEVKGYPSELYAAGERAGEPRKWNPGAQVRTYFGDALLALLRMRDANPGALVGLALPDKPTYANLIDQVEASLRHLRVTVLLVAQDGTVTVRIDSRG